MRQRVMIAMALSCNPALLIADEPTTALDVTIQAQILELMLDLQAKINMSIMVITHNLGVIAEMADRVIVMYCGKIVESADVRAIFHNPLHPYTRQLLASVPRLGAEQDRLQEIPGVVPNLYALPPGCDFHPRCAEARDACKLRLPLLLEREPGHWVACDQWAGRVS
jgi:peptide/nickel transport system ATP-binding protein/oligopeptide transport system ATP-binding protein